SLVRQELRNRVLSILFASRRKAERIAGFKLLKRSWTDADLATVDEAWMASPSEQLAAIMATMAPSEYLANHLSELANRLHGTQYIRRLYIRAAECKPDCKNELLPDDGTSYVYVVAKLGLGLDAALAKRIYQGCGNDDDRELLIWCFGRLHLWTVLSEIAAVGALQGYSAPLTSAGAPTILSSPRHPRMRIPQEPTTRDTNNSGT
ncbi:MAG: hypothetical protein V2A73_13910, partial [Pseudomonadota bacterium]